MRRIDLDEVVLSPAAVAGWLEIARKAAQIAVGLGIDPASIPDEQAGILRNGNLKIFVRVNGAVEVSMVVPRSEWSYRMPRN